MALSSCKNSTVSTLTDTKVFLYGATQYTNRIYQFELNKSTGQLNAMTTPYLAAESFPMILSNSNNKKFLVSANYGAHSVSSYKINQLDGSLTLVGTYALTGSAAPAWIVNHPSKNIFYTADSGTNYLSILDLDQDTGVITVRSRIAAGSGVTALAINNNGSVMYSADQGVNQIGIYSIDSNGDLSLAGTESMTGGSQVNHLEIAPSGNYLYTANWGTHTISSYTISGTSLISLGADLDNGAGGNYMINISPDGQYLYANKPIANSFTRHNINTASGVVSAATATESLSGIVSFVFYDLFTFTARWTGSSGGLAIQSRNYSSTDGIATSALFESEPIQGLYKLLKVEVPQYSSSSFCQSGGLPIGSADSICQ